jgi:pimeloyl-ACP methyl ester carboxylesterase
MKKGWKITLFVLGLLLLLLLIGPFLVPIPPLNNSQPPQALAEPDSQFVEINDINVHYKQLGTGEPVFILLHGFGASTFSWREVIAPLSSYGTVIAYDRPAFGLTERPLEWEDDNPYTLESNVELLLGLMNTMQIEEAILIGNSAGGTVATAFALAHPERVTALVEVDAAIYQTSPDSKLFQWFINTPQMDRIGPLLARYIFQNRGENFLELAWYDPSAIANDPEILAGYQKPYQSDNWDKALWKFTQASGGINLAEQLDQIHAPSLIISGADDQIVPLESSIQLANDIAGSELAILQNCGHLPHEECPDAFLQAIDGFINNLMQGE